MYYVHVIMYFLVPTGTCTVVHETTCIMYKCRHRQRYVNVTQTVWHWVHVTVVGGDNNDTC